MYTVNSPNYGHFGTQASVLYLESVLYSVLGLYHLAPIHVVVTNLKHLEILLKGYHACLLNF